MKLYHDTERELFFSDYKPMPPLRGQSIESLEELINNLEQAQENAFLAGSDLLEIALDMDTRKAKLYLAMYQKKAARDNK